ncbi:MAG: LptF/LptG family permease [Bacteroidota bacterium]
MLKKIDRYIVGKYLKTFLFTVMIFTQISIIIDFSDKVEDFIEEPCTITQIIFDYYLNFVLYINGLLIPLYALISVIFFTSRMAYNSEIISILNAGVSFRRIMRPYLIAAGIITIFHLVSNHYLIPIGNKTRLDFEHTYIWKYSDKGKTNDVHLFIAPDTKIYIKYYRKRDTTGTDFRIEKFEDNKMVYMLNAKRAEWIGEPNKWRLRNFEIRTFDDLKESIIIGEGQQMDTTLNLRPEDFVRYQNQKEMMSTPAMDRFIQRERERGVGNTKVYEIEKHRRTSEPFTIVILTLIGMAVASRKVRGGIGLHLAIGVAIGAAYVFLSRFSTVFATNDNFSPLLGVWLPNIVFLVVAIVLIQKAQK